MCSTEARPSSERGSSGTACRTWCRRRRSPDTRTGARDIDKRRKKKKKTGISPGLSFLRCGGLCPEPRHPRRGIEILELLPVLVRPVLSGVALVAPLGVVVPGLLDSLFVEVSTEHPEDYLRKLRVGLGIEFAFAPRAELLEVLYCLFTGEVFVKSKFIDPVLDLVVLLPRPRARNDALGGEGLRKLVHAVVGEPLGLLVDLRRLGDSLTILATVLVSVVHDLREFLRVELHVDDRVVYSVVKVNFRRHVDFPVFREVYMDPSPSVVE